MAHELDTRIVRAAVYVVLAAATVAAALHFYALASYRASFGDGPLVRRAETARRAAAVEPFNRSFAARRGRLLGELLHQDGDLELARDVLRAALEGSPDDTELQALFGRVDAEWRAREMTVTP